MNPGHCLILRICFDSFCSGWAKSRCGGVLAVVFSDFYRQHSFGFHTFRTVIHQFSLTLMSSTSFGALVISGTKHAKLSQNGRNPRPAGLGQASRRTPMWFHRATPRTWSWTQDQANIKCSTQVLWVKTERRTPSLFGSTFSDKPFNQDPNRLEGEYTTHDQHDRTMDGRGEPEPGRPA
jgi:hypothetical protein